MGRGWFTGPGIGVLNGIFLRLDCTNDPLTAGLEINAATAGEPGLILQSTDDNATNPLLEIQSSAAAVLAEWQTRGGLNFAAAVGQAAPGIIGLAGTRFLHTYGVGNLFLGESAGNFTLTGSNNWCAGYEAGLSLTTGNENWLAGYQAGRLVTSGRWNIAAGYRALTSATTSWSNIAIGTQSLQNCTTGGGNVAIGENSLSQLTTPLANVAIGLGGGQLLTTASNCTAIGYSALRNTTWGGFNTAVGSSALYSNTTGISNIAVGSHALFYLVTHSSNTAVGRQAGYRCTGTGNSFYGFFAGLNQQDGDYNVLIGYEAGHGAALHNKSGSVFIGYQAGYNETNSNRLYITNSNTATPLIYGEFDTWRLAFGNQYAVNKYGQLAHASGFFAAVGDAQGSPDSFIVRRAVATHAVNTWYALYPDGGTTPERLTIAADTGWSIDVLVIGLTQNAAQQWGYQIYGVLERDNAGNTTLAATATTVLFESDANYDAQLANDDANEALEVQVRRTGGVDYDIRWVATVRTAEASYPS